MKKLETVDLIRIALFSVVIAICSWISIPTTVPFTLQTFAIFTTLQVLGGRKGTYSILIYLLLGAIGVPVFANFTAGIGILFGSTGGYLVGFLICGLVYWAITAKFGEKMPVIVIAMGIGLVLCYTFGTVWFTVIYGRNTGTVGILTVLTWCVFPFVLPDLAKMAAAVALSKQLKHHLVALSRNGK